MTTKIRKTLAVLLAISLLASGVGAAAIAWDTSTTNATSTDSDLSGSSTTVTFNPDNASKAIWVEVQNATTSNLTLEMSPATAGVDYVAYTNDTPTEEDATYGHYAWNISHSELADIPREHTGGTYNVTIYNTSGDNHTELLTTEVVLDSDDINEKRSIVAVSDDSGTDAAALTPLVADTLELDTESPGLFSLSTLTVWSDSDDNDIQISSWSAYTGVNGSNTDVTVLLANSTTATAYEDAAADREDGEALKMATVQVNGINHLVYKNELPEEYPDNTTAVVYDTSADSLEIELGPEYDGVGQVNVRSTAGQGYSFTELWSNFGITKAFQVAW